MGVVILNGKMAKSKNYKMILPFFILLKRFDPSIKPIIVKN